MSEEEKKPAESSAEEKKDEESWTCEKCGHINHGNFCGNCGAPRPVKKETVEAKKEEVSALHVESAKAEQPSQQKTAAAEPVQQKEASKIEQKPKKQGKAKKVITCICECVLVFALGFGGGYAAQYAGSSKKIDALSKQVSDLNDQVSDLKDDVEDLEKGGSFFEGLEGLFGRGQGRNDDNLFGDYSEKGKDDQDDDSSDKEDDSDSAALGLIVQETDQGVVIVGFADQSEAQDAGLKEGDIIEKLDGQDADTFSKIQSFLKDKKPGDTVKITVERDGKEVDADLKLIEKTTSRIQFQAPSTEDDSNESHA